MWSEEEECEDYDAPHEGEKMNRGRSDLEPRVQSDRTKTELKKIKGLFSDDVPAPSNPQFSS